MTALALLQSVVTAVQHAADLAPLWEIVRNTLITLTAGGVAWIVRSLRDMDKRQVVIEHIVVGVDGKNGLRARMTAAEGQIGLQRDRNVALDTVAEIERTEYEGDERRHEQRRFRDMIRDELENPTRRTP